ncbi:helix-turn-helix domain-containing protein [Megasphaera sp. DJF_B143]|uniref:helix-turn-helix domain-containing protein n=1 Tax=Megasphaera sp. DJF_B143 TaxID=537288 RepID=UPI003517E3F8
MLIPSRAALVLGCTRRTINRLIIRYHQEGKAAFRHGNKGRKPAHTIPDSAKESIPFNCTKTTILMPILPIFSRFWNSRNISVFLFQP